MYAILDIASYLIRIRVAEQIGWAKDLMTHSKQWHLFCAWLDKIVLVRLVTQRLRVWVSIPAGCTGLSSTTHNWGDLAQNTEPQLQPGCRSKNCCLLLHLCVHGVCVCVFNTHCSVCALGCHNKIQSAKHFEKTCYFISPHFTNNPLNLMEERTQNKTRIKI